MSNIPVAILTALLFLTMPMSGPALAAIEADKNAAVVFVYQRIDDDSVPQSSIPADQFKLHIAELKAGGYNVLPLEQIVDAVKSGSPLPEKTVAITFDGAWLPTLSIAAPLLDEAKFPFTVFFSSEQADAGGPTHMSWSQLKNLRKDKLASFGLLPAAYAHMTTNTVDANTALINKAVSRYREMLKEEPVFFSWPYGEYSNALKKQIASYNFKAAFGQQSGVVYADSDFLALPRFTMTGDVGDLDRFRLTAGALPLPVTDVVPEDPGNVTGNPPLIGFTVTPEIKDLSRLSCFISDIGKVGILKPGSNRVEIRLEEPLQEARARVNCTLPVSGDTGWRWFSTILVLPGNVPADDAAATPPEEAPQDVPSEASSDTE